MPTKPIKAKIQPAAPGKRPKVVALKSRQSVSQRIGAEKKAKRAVKAIQTAAPGRVHVTRRKS